MCFDRARLLGGFLLLLFCQFVFGQQAGRTPDAEQKRIERLTALAKLWGTVRYFHPYLGYKDIDWDRALIETIPKVNAAGSVEEYEAAIGHLLSFLEDRSTRVVKTGAAAPPAAQTEKENVRLENGVLIIEAARVARLAPGNFNEYRQALQKIGPLIPQAGTVVFDLRGSGPLAAGENAAFVDLIAAEFMSAALRQMLDRTIPLGTVRYRMHSGFAPQIGGTSGGYYSGFTTDAAPELVGTNKNAPPPIAVLINEHSPNAGAALSGLQASGAGFVIGESGTAELGAGVFSMRLADNVQVQIRTAELVNPDGSVGFKADLTAGQDAFERALEILSRNELPKTAKNAGGGTGAPTRGISDKTYAEMEFPAAEYRLLALFRFWNVINFFYPYKDLIGEPWDDILPRYIAKFEANTTAGEYYITVQEMVAEIDDSHGGARVQFKNPPFYPPVSVRFIEDQTVVDRLLDESAPVKIGETVLEIDGEPVEKYGEKFARRIAASTPQALQWRLHNIILRGEKDSKVRLTVRDISGKTREVEMTRTVAADDARWQQTAKNDLPVYGILPGGFGYVDLTRLQVADVDKMFEAVKNAEAVIFDMRGYPNGTAWSVAPRLTERTDVAAALFSRPFLTGKDLISGEDLRGVSYTFTQYLPPRTGDVYKGRIVMLIDERAVSQSEHTALFFEAARPDITFIGTPTNGANGDVTSLVLPGNIVVGFTGHNVRHADGRQLQRVGIQPHLKVAPTIRGALIEGRDEVLEAAVKFLQEKK
jgi:C-terminal processing protease CtpA/Prc